MKKINQIALVVCLYMLAVYCTVVIFTSSQMLLNIISNNSKETTFVFLIHFVGLISCLVSVACYTSDDKNDNSKD